MSMCMSMCFGSHELCFLSVSIAPQETPGDLLAVVGREKSRRLAHPSRSGPIASVASCSATSRRPGRESEPEHQAGAVAARGLHSELLLAQLDTHGHGVDGERLEKAFSRSTSRGWCTRNFSSRRARDRVGAESEPPFI